MTSSTSGSEKPREFCLANVRRGRIAKVTLSEQQGHPRGLLWLGPRLAASGFQQDMSETHVLDALELQLARWERALRLFLATLVPPRYSSK